MKQAIRVILFAFKTLTSPLKYWVKENSNENHVRWKSGIKINFKKILKKIIYNQIGI